MRKFYETERFADAATAASALLKNVGLRFALVGGNAVDYWVNPPPTVDIDFAVRGSPAAFFLLLDALETDKRFKLIAHRTRPKVGLVVLYVADLQSGIRIDVIWSDHPAFRTAVGRAVVRKIGSVTTPIAVPEDLLILKWIAHRAKDKPMWERLRRYRNLDTEYVAHKAKLYDMNFMKWSIAEQRARS